MKLILSLMNGETLMLSVASIDAIQFIGGEVHIISEWGTSSDYFMKDIRSIVIT